MSKRPRTYPLSVQFWRQAGAIEIVDCNDRRLCTVPKGALEVSGDLNWPYVVYCAKACVEEEGELVEVTDFAGGEGRAVDLDKPVQAGKYIFRRRDDPMLPCTPSRGPVGKSRGRPAGSSISEGTMSHSTRSSVDQNRLRIAVIARDGRCLISDRPFDSCIGAHIIPFSRPDILSSILGYRDEWPYETWMGLLLEYSVHKAYDQYSVSLYPRSEEEWVVHVFYSQDGAMMQHHGKSFTSKRFNLPSRYWPMKELLLWHHKQCIQMHYRGFSHRMTATDETVST